MIILIEVKLVQFFSIGSFSHHRLYLGLLNEFMHCRVTVYRLSSNYPVFIVGLDQLGTEQFMQPVIDPLIGKWLIVVKGLGSIVRQEEMEA